ncbi:recombination-associated protein RdgC (plasmid) [Pseudomonas fulva]|jgi:recombination associated protein RdgC|uniref:Recombination-associated protein RdgC n=2 Tax=Pseudomonas putida group TaxID=136845 RepID=A0ABD7BM54_PSEPU|nr:MULTISPECIES: recombination-associated protein RdgC [Pseudomonas]MCT8162827.1 recombination-associated protein RdgC [Pseudomonas sp. HD6422]MCT8181404.1 recombination-associated protein RdgC [Pseudomonas sp. HD6421]MDH1929004.1 recombination-associated protein RdgC [Pseudomonas sp. GD03696]PLP92264.1 recombination-associated protein RdgC [Pseudomonas sp. FFUP_PS_41]QDQ70298.1 recombination-associated protein RdgC [Pseudomonas sp.]
MWFKNLLTYRMTQDVSLTCEALEEALRSKPARKPESQVLQTVGFISPSSKNPEAPLAHKVEGVYLLALRTYDRLLPPSAVADELAEKVEEIETSQARKVYKKEKDQLKDEIIQSMLPRAFIRKKTTYAALDLVNKLIFVNTSSAIAAEALLSTLREVVGSLPVRPVTVKIAPTATFTDWVKNGQAAENFYVLNNCTLKDPDEDGGEINVKNQDLTSDEIKQLIASGKVVTKISLAYKDLVSFSLNDKLSVQGLRFESLLQEKAVQDGGDEKDGQFDASFLLMMATLNEVIPQLLTVLGGEEIPQGL